MNEDERIRRAEIIAERRNNRIPASSINNKKKKKMSSLTKTAIQIITSISIFGLCYFLYQNNSYALEIIKPVISSDTDFQKLYSSISDAVKNTAKEEYFDEKIQEDNNKSEQNLVKDNLENQNNSNDEENSSKKESESEKIEQSVVSESDIEFIKRSVNFIKPLEGTITSKFGEREQTDIISGNHEGIDIGAEEGTEIKASMEGIAEIVSEEGDYGKHIKISNGEVSTIYGHCSELLIKEGESIMQGMIIAKVGNTGKSTGPHLHFEIRRNDNPVNPEELIKF